MTVLAHFRAVGNSLVPEHVVARHMRYDSLLIAVEIILQDKTAPAKGQLHFGGFWRGLYVAHRGQLNLLWSYLN